MTPKAQVVNVGKPVPYKGVTIQLFKRPGEWFTDYGFTTDIGIRGVGQRSAAQALADARQGIDAREAE